MSTERELRPAALAAAKHLVDYRTLSGAQMAAMCAYIDAATDRIITLEAFEALIAYEAKQGEREKEKVKKEQVAGKVVSIIMKFSPAVETDIVPAARLKEDLELDSLDHMEMVLALEDEIDGDITDEEACKLKTVGDVQAFMERAVG